MDKLPMTAPGFAALEAELKHRTSVERPRIIEAIQEALAGLVSDGSITQDQAEEVATTLGSADLGPRGGHGGGGRDLGAAAEAEGER